MGELNETELNGLTTPLDEAAGLDTSMRGT